MKKEIIEEVLFELAGLTPDWIEEKYKLVYERWKFDNSDDVWIDGRLVDKKEKLLIKVSRYDIRPMPKEIIVSETKNGFPLTEKMFIDKMIKKLSKFTDADYPDDIWQMRINLFLDYLKNKNNKAGADFLITPIERPRLISIHTYLSENKYIDVDIDSWLYWFSKQSWINQKKKPSKIKWTGAAYHLTNVVYLICGNMEVQTETAMKKAFTLKTGNFQKLTKDNIKGKFYTDIKNILNWAERFLQ